MKRPELNDNLSGTDFKDFYWLKNELIDFCKSKGINATGGKQELSDSIICYLQTGKITKIVPKQPTKSKFDWNNAEITLDTEITDNYKNSENVRAFMNRKIGSHFHFHTEYMDWTKQNTGKTMRDAIAEWERIYEMKKDKNYRTTISSQFEYNTYIRDFLTDNKDKTIKEAIHFWKLKRNRRGENIYAKSDLQMIDCDENN
jgi:hypothetical protein